jgi:CxxC motif-containing protein (DUF1111 family)
MPLLCLAALCLWLVACSDQTGVTVPDQLSNSTTNDSTANGAASDIELADGHEHDDEIDAARTPLSGGATTVNDATATAFESAAPNLTAAGLARHEAGDAQFGRVFLADPASADPGLGPVFDNVSCESCHFGDGRGRPPAGNEQFESLLFRASVSGRERRGGPAPVPGFGTQLQLRAVSGLAPEAQAVLAYVERSGTFADGTSYQLRMPRFTVTGVYRPLPAGVLISPRVASAVFGLGLLEAVDESDLRALADPNDRNRDGISGRPNRVWDGVRERLVIGRFGWKANQPNLLQQAAGAFNGDIGVTSSLFPSESCEEDRPECAPHEPPEVGDRVVTDVAFYTQTLGVPARRNVDDSTAQRGERLFYAAGCNGCHTPTLRTGTLPGVPEVSGQAIHPYTDLLLHDMGPDLADQRPDFEASGSEWRTAPLWGIGLVKTVNGHTNFLHDGRARSLLEAVLWHGGEAEAARNRVRQLPAEQRAALIAFLESL